MRKFWGLEGETGISTFSYVGDRRIWIKESPQNRRGITKEEAKKMFPHWTLRELDKYGDTIIDMHVFVPY